MECWRKEGEGRIERAHDKPFEPPAPSPAGSFIRLALSSISTVHACAHACTTVRPNPTFSVDEP